MGDLLQRLKQRKLVQWALAYIAAAFALIQVIDVVASRFGWPAQLERILILALAAGFFVVLVIAWYHGEQGRQRVSGPELLLIALVLAVGGGLLWHFGKPGSSPTTTRVAAVKGASPQSSTTHSSAPPVAASSMVAVSPTGAGPTAAQSIPAKSIAVLPFENLSEDKGNAYFADGMQDLILTKLADIGGLKVISRTSTEKYASRPEDLKTVGQQLGVATILEGSVQKAGNQVLINVQLIDAKTDNHIWAQSYTRTLDNIFGVEGEVAGKIAQALNTKLTPAENKAIASIPTHNKQAYDAFFKGTYYLYDAQSKEQPSELKQAVMFLHQAITHDPGFADAYSALAAAYRHMGGHNDKAEAAARHALTLNPDSTFARIQLARLLDQAGHFHEALEQAQVALHKEPDNAGLVNGLGNIYFDAGRYSEALTAYKHAIALSPGGGVAGVVRVNMAQVLASERRYADARGALNDVLAHDPSAVGVASLLASVYEAGSGDLDSARKVLESVPIPVASSGALSDAWYSLDLYGRDYAAALKVMEAAPASWFTSEQYPLGLYQGRVYQAQGDAPRAKAAFAAARMELEGWIKMSPDEADLHANLALALAGLGEHDAALDEARRAMALQPIGKYPDAGIAQIANMAAVESRVGAAGAAIKLLDRLLSMPAGMYASVDLLRIDPAWDPIREDQRFQALLAKKRLPYMAKGAVAQP